MAYRVKKDTIVYKGAYTSKGAPCLVVLKLVKGTLTNTILYPNTHFTPKNRANKAKVMAIYRIDLTKWPNVTRKEKIVGYVHSWQDQYFTYKSGQIIEPRFEFCNDPYKPCASGIYFYMTKEAAIDFVAG